jgi:UDP-GlcNAc:undecaprenyl-phosphate/decaprenyl-phosphate GlcNAc-1-phosphate transferase
MTVYLVAFALAGVGAALLTPVIRQVALRMGAVSRPGGRNVHRRVVPRLGGIAIFLALAVASATLCAWSGDVRALFADHWRHVIGVAGGATVMCAVGAIDDIRRLRPIHKLLAQCAAATFAFAWGFRIDAIAVPFGGRLNMGMFALPVTIVWIVGIVNAINLIDGLDGLAAGIVLFAALTNLIVSHFTGAIFIGLLMAIIAGAICGFLLFNFNPARIFMGDSGSYLLGYVLATTVLVGSTQKASTAVSLLVPCLALGVPIFDTLFTIVRRFLERRPIFSPDRGHIHHRLINMGLTHRRAVLILYGVSLALSGAAVATCLGQSWQGGVAVLAASAVLAVLVRSAGYMRDLQDRLARRGKLRSQSFEAIRLALPAAIGGLQNAGTEKEIIDRLGVQLRALARVELVRLEGVVAVHRWQSAVEGSEEADLLTARYPLGTPGLARSALVLSWSSDREDVAGDLDVALQILADLVAVRLEAIGSPLAPRPMLRAAPHEFEVKAELAGRTAV